MFSHEALQRLVEACGINIAGTKKMFQSLEPEIARKDDALTIFSVFEGCSDRRSLAYK